MNPSHVRYSPVDELDERGTVARLLEACQLIISTTEDVTLAGPRFDNGLPRWTGNCGSYARGVTN